MTKACALIIFIKNPEEGKVKTRLAAGIGSHSALKVYHKLLDITKHAAIKSDTDRFLFYSSEIKLEDNWPEDMFKKHLQQGVDLGDRMLNAFQTVLQKYESAIIIGSDCPGISPEIIEETKTALIKYDCVIGPSYDGGYYLLAMKQLIPELFKDIKWSSTSVLSDTIKVLNKMGLSFLKLSPLRDIDTIEDLAYFPELNP
ncbi:MAG: glycosyltransferase [Saprospiraceae bacterium]|nr:glycosyltransferase [Saprospiraceae bacterium]